MLPLFNYNQKIIIIIILFPCTWNQPDEAIQRSSQFVHVGGYVDHLRGHPDVVPALALWLTCSRVEFYFSKFW